MALEEGVDLGLCFPSSAARRRIHMVNKMLPCFDVRVCLLSERRVARFSVSMSIYGMMLEALGGGKIKPIPRVCRIDGPFSA